MPHINQVTGSNSISVAEHEVLTLLALVRNFAPSHHIATTGGWDIADCVSVRLYLYPSISRQPYLTLSNVGPRMNVLRLDMSRRTLTAWVSATPREP